MRKRISLKGRGADIFFGDVAETPLTSPNPSPSNIITPTNGDGELAQNGNPVPRAEVESIGIRKQDSAQESKHARKQGRNANQATPSSQGMPPGPLSEDVLNSIWPSVSQPATITNAFRYTDEELSRLTDAIYQITRLH